MKKRKAVTSKDLLDIAKKLKAEEARKMFTTIATIRPMSKIRPPPRFPISSGVKMMRGRALLTWAAIPPTPRMER